MKRTEIKSSVSYCPPWQKQLKILTLESQRNLFSKMCSTRYKCSRKMQEKGHQLTLVPQVVGDYGRWQLKVVLLLWIPMFFCGTQFVTTDYMNMQVFLGNQTRSSAVLVFSPRCFTARTPGRTLATLMTQSFPPIQGVPVISYRIEIDAMHTRNISICFPVEQAGRRTLKER